MSLETDLLYPTETTSTEDEAAAISAASSIGQGWGRLELGMGRVLHLWPCSDLELGETVRSALAPTLEPAPPRPCAEPDAGVLVLSADAEGAAATLAAVRACATTRLRPVAVVAERGAGPELERLADVVLGRAAATLRLGLLPLVALAERVDELDDASHLPVTERCELDFLRFLASRDVEELAPVADAGSPIGYRQPLAEALLRRTPEGALETLEEIRAAGHLEAVPTESIFLCGSCDSSRLSVREICPGCRAPALVEEAVIHHFACAHVGPAASFQRPGGLVCPKCERSMHHAGVEYDRPGVDVRCRCCDLRVVEGIAEARCLSCDRRAELDEQRRLELFTYRPLPSLQRVAQRTVSPIAGSTEILQMALPTLEPAVHALLRERAEAVCRRYGRPATLMRIEVQELAALQDELGRRETHRRLQALARGLATVLRTTDLVSVDGQAAVEVVLVETDAEGAEAAHRRLEAALTGRDAEGIDLRVEIEPLVGDAAQ